MADIDLAQLTNGTTANDGTGVFDVLIQAVERHVEEQYTEGRLAGTDYATVYLGSMQSVLAQSVQFLLNEQQADKQAELIAEQIVSEQKKNEAGGLIDLEKQKIQEQIDLIIAQTAAEYEKISASQQDSVRRNLLNSKEVIRVDKETELVISQNSELLLNGPIDRSLKTEQTVATTSGALDKTNETNAQVALINAQELKVQSETLHERFMAIGKLDKEQGFDVTYDLTGAISAITTGSGGLIDEQILKAQEEIDLLQSRDLEQLAATTRMDNESSEKVLLLQAQTLGFKTDAKQKLMKQLYEGYAINTTTAGEIPTGAPSGATGTKLDAVANDILDDLGSTVNI